MAFFRRVTGKFMEWVVFLSMIVMVVVVFLQVLSRYVFASPIPWTEEMARFIFVRVTLIGTFLALKSKGHISIETFINRFLTPQVRSFVSTVTDFLLIYYFIYLTVMGVVMVQKTSEDLTPVMLIPFSFIYVAIPISAVMMVIYLLRQILKLEWKKISGEDG